MVLGPWWFIKCKSAAPSTLRVKKSISGNTKLIPVTPDDILRSYESCVNPALNEGATWRFLWFLIVYVKFILCSFICFFYSQKHAAAGLHFMNHQEPQIFGWTTPFKLKLNHVNLLIVELLFLISPPGWQQILSLTLVCLALNCCLQFCLIDIIGYDSH